MSLFLAIVILFGSPNLQALLDEKRWDEAEARIAQLPPESRVRFQGIVAMGRGQPAVAAQAFEAALQSTPGVPELHLHAAHAYYKLGKYNDVLRHTRASSALQATVIAQPLLEARALEGLERDAEAYSVLRQACETFEGENRPWLELAALAHRKKLTSEVRRAARHVLSRKPERDVVLSLFRLLYGDPDALPILERIAASYPADAEFRGLLGHVYARERRWFAAAKLFEDATQMGGDFAFEAADQYRMAGTYRAALRMNGMVPSSERQMAQRVSILFERAEYDRIVAIDVSFKDPGSLYRVAYAYYAIGDHVQARARAKALLTSPYREEALALIASMSRTQP